MPRSKANIRDEELRINAEPYDWSKHSLSDEQVKEFALGIIQGTIFTEIHVRPQDQQHLGLIFLPLMFGELSPEVKGAMEKSPPGMCYARVNSRNMLPRSINGYPIFTSCAFLSREDTGRVQDKYNQLNAAIDAA
jgi:hypothetical protein